MIANNSRLKPRRKAIILGAMIFIIAFLCCFNVSAELTKSLSTNNKIATIKDGGSTRAIFELVYNTDTCGGYYQCYAIVKAEVKSLQKNVWDSVRFEDANGKYKSSVKYNLYVLENGKYIPYDSNKEYAGIYYFKITGDKTPEEVIEWIPTLYGVELNEWTVWGSWSNHLNIGLKGYWNLDELTGTSFANSINTTSFLRTYGSSASYSGGRFYRGINGSASTGGMSIINKTDFNATVTFNFWINLSSIVDGKRMMSAEGGNVAVRCNNAGKGIHYELYSASAVHIASPVYNCTLDNQWKMITGVMNSSSTCLYVNATLQGCVAGTGMIELTTDVGFMSAGTYDGADGIIDEIGVWNRTLNQSEIDELYQINFITPITPKSAQQYYSKNVFFNASAQGQSSSLTNITLFIDGIFNDSSVITGTTNQSSWYKNLTLGSHNWNVVACDITFTCFSSGVITFNAIPFLENSQTYNPTTTSGSLENFAINITYDSINYISVSAPLYYNNTLFYPTQTGTGNNKMFNVNITVPKVTAATTKSFMWQFAFTNSSGGIEYYNSTSYNQIINAFQIDNCTIYDTRIMNVSLYDEDSRNLINGTIEAIINLWNTPRTLLVGSYNASLSFLDSNNPLGLCMNSTSSYSMDYQLKYYSNLSIYSTEFKFGQYIPVSNTTTHIVNLYDLLDSQSSTFTITLQGDSPSDMAGAVIDVQRKYFPINQYLSVESPITDSMGIAIAHLVTGTIYYQFVVSKNGVILGTFSDQQVTCQNPATGDCRIILNLAGTTPSMPDFTTYGNITTSFSWLQSTRNLYMTFTSTDGGTHNVTWIVTKVDGWGNTTICSQTAIEYSGTFLCAVPMIYTNSTQILAKVYSDGIYLGANWFSLMGKSSDIFGGTRVILAIIMFCTLTLLMFSSPVMMILGAIGGMAFAVMFHLVDGGSMWGNGSLILWFVLAGGIIAYQVRNRT